MESYCTSEGNGDYLRASNDYGMTWSLLYQQLSTCWYVITTSSDGKYVYAAQGGNMAENVYYSHNYGQDWYLSYQWVPDGCTASSCDGSCNCSMDYQGLAASADGSIVYSACVAAASNGASAIWRSTDYGQS